MKTRADRIRPLILPTLALALAITSAGSAGDDILWNQERPGGSTSGTSYSTVYGGQFPNDTEVADDFEATGLVERLVVDGRGCGQCSAPIVDGVYVRFYEWTPDGPGALQQESFLAGDDPRFQYDDPYPFTLDITLPTPFAASGWHFVSVQVAFGGDGGSWNFVQTNRFDYINAPVQFRDNLDGGVWMQDFSFAGGPIEADVVITLIGEAGATTPVIDTLSRTTVTGSDRIMVEGSGFGAPGNGQLLVAGAPAIVTSWSAVEIIGYVPEGIPAGTVDLTVVNLGTPSAPMPITIVPRAPVGRVQWVFEGDGDYSTFPPSVGPDGTVYFDDIDGNLYAMSPGGGLHWIVDALRGAEGGGDEGPIAIGTDGTIYVATNPLGPTVALVAFNPDGTHRWTFTVPHALTWQAGPGIGPDGRIYGALNAATLLGNDYDVFAIDTDGTLAWSTAAAPFVFEDAAHGSEFVFGPSTPGGAIDQMVFTADRNGDGRNWGFALDNGSQRFAAPTGGGNDVGQGQLAGDPATGDFFMLEFSGIGGAGWGLQAFDADGDRTWRFDPGIASGATRPAVGPEGNVYFGWDLTRLSGVSAEGDPLWTRVQPGVTYADVSPSPVAPMVLATGQLGFSQPSFAEARSTTDGALLWTQPLADDLGADTAVYAKPRFTADGSRAYFTALQLPITPTSTYRVFAIDTSAGLIGDIDGDGVVGFTDLVALLSAWGPCEGCVEDLDGDGQVSFADVLLLLGNWG